MGRGEIEILTQSLDDNYEHTVFAPKGKHQGTDATATLNKVLLFKVVWIRTDVQWQADEGKNKRVTPLHTYIYISLTPRCRWGGGDDPDLLQ